jgi:hypothetical protein
MTTTNDLTELSRIIGETAKIMATMYERQYRNGWMSKANAREWRLSPERWEAIEAGVIEAFEHDEPAPVVSLSERRAAKVSGGA